ncbi:MAG: hypothetical protein AAF492_25180, partial [Verrucomicrobiota bacterium]
DYVVDVNVASVPDTLDVPTTLMSIRESLGPQRSSVIVDFGFRAANPTAIELTSFTAQLIGGDVLIEWSTALELNTAGFHILRGLSLEGPATQLNPALIPGQGSEAGFDYAFLDTDVTPGVTYYYWLEEVEDEADTFTFGPVVANTTVPQPGQIFSSLTTASSGVYRLRFETMVEAGVPVSVMDPAQFQIRIDGDEVDVFQTAFNGPMQAGDFLLFHVPEDLVGKPIWVGMKDGAARMDFAFGFPNGQAGDIFSGVASNGVLGFQTASNLVRYFVMGFREEPVWVLDVSNATEPDLMIGHSTLNQTNDFAIYLSYPADATLLAVDDEAVIDIESVNYLIDEENPQLMWLIKPDPDDVNRLTILLHSNGYRTESFAEGDVFTMASHLVAPPGAPDLPLHASVIPGFEERLSPNLDYWKVSARHDRFGHLGTRSVWCLGYTA